MTGTRGTRTASRAVLGFSALALVAWSCDGQSTAQRSRESKGNGGSSSGAESGGGGTQSGRSGAAGSTSGGGSGPTAGTGVGGGVGASAGEPQGGDSGEGSEGGAGGTPCPGLTRCGDECVQIDYDTRHCGACFRECQQNGPEVPVCMDGACWGNECGPPDRADCYPDVEGCETFLSTFDHCARCGDSCAAAHATGTCNDRICEYQCEAGFDDCDAGSPDCETRLDTAENCGACDRTCPSDLPLCSGGTCAASCVTPRPTQCGERCVDLSTDSSSCGACNSPCESYQVCEGGRCTPRYVGSEVTPNPEHQGVMISVHSNGSFAVLTSLNGPIDLDPGAGTDIQAPEGGYDAALSKFNADGTYAWSRVIGGMENDWPGWVATGADGSLVETFQYGGSVDLNPGPGVASHTTEAYSEPVVVKLTSNGDFVWGKAFVITGTQSHGERGPVAVDAAGSVYVSGSFMGSVDLDPGSGTTTRSSAETYTTFVVKLGANGDYAWSVVFSSCGIFSIGDLDVDAQGVLWLVGTFGGDCDLDPGPGSSSAGSLGSQDGFIVRLDAGTGATINTEIVGTPDTDYLDAVAFDTDGSHYVSGGTSSDDRTWASFVMQSDSSGVRRWEKRYDGMGGITFVAAPGGGVIGSGTGFRGPGPRSQGVFLTKLDRDGNTVWAIDIPGRNSGGFDIGTHANGFVVVGGTSLFPIDLDPGAGTKLVTTPGTYISRYAL